MNASDRLYGVGGHTGLSERDQLSLRFTTGLTLSPIRLRPFFHVSVARSPPEARSVLSGHRFKRALRCIAIIDNIIATPNRKTDRDQASDNTPSRPRRVSEDANTRTERAFGRRIFSPSILPLGRDSK